MLALALALSAVPTIAQSSVDNDPTQTQVYDDTTAEILRLQKLVDRMRRAHPDGGVPPDGAIAPQEP